MGRAGDIRLSFNEAAEIYDGVRPSYPAAMFDLLFEMLPPRPAIVEVGPGTGQATKDLLARGAWVHAIEIGPAMAAKLRSNLPSDRLDVTIGDFEVVNITPASADAVFSATAYHWISRQAGRSARHDPPTWWRGGDRRPDPSRLARRRRLFRRQPAGLRAVRTGPHRAADPDT